MQTVKSQLKDISELNLHPKNPHTHPPEQIKALGKSLDKWGQYKNIIIWRKDDSSPYWVLAGNGLLQAAKKQGLKQVEVKDFSKLLTEEQAEALMVSDILTPEMAGLDEGLMVELLANIDNYEESVPGAYDGLLESMLAESGGDSDGDDVVEPPTEFKEYDDDIETQYCCPSCQYEWSGSPK
ncbi:MAG: ParB N-terminal domain-containing protein [Colwellia sp.]|nr:ParB N-terminal domain-containing protein [Colwellia sp.]